MSFNIEEYLNTEEEIKGLYVVATPIGNIADISIRAIKVLSSVDFVICEETKFAGRLLRALGIKKELVPMNEHNEKEQANLLLKRLLYEGESAALISDAGTPVFADPGAQLVWQCLQNNIKVSPLPGASSIMGALMATGLQLKNFLFLGFLPANTEKRIEELKKIRNIKKYDIVLLDTPYRLKPLLRDMALILGPKRQVTLSYKLTMPEEKILWGTLEEMQLMAEGLPKGEFVLILKKPKSSGFYKKGFKK